MKAVMLMFDSLNRRMLSPYGGTDVATPQFGRLAGRTATFDNCYVGSMPCMPARRELHTGRYNFLHRAWGPLEPFDDSVPEMLSKAGVYTHLITDHYHYWQDGGATYHTRFNSCEFVRGQEVDAWKPAIKDPAFPKNYDRELAGSRYALERINFANRDAQPAERDTCLAQSFELGLAFLDDHADSDNWFLQLEVFDPHEPFSSPERYKQAADKDYEGPHFDWPFYRPVSESPEVAEHIRNEARALYAMCDAYLGRLLDCMDRHGLWEDTMLIVNTDHGFMLGEHGWWAKNNPPMYNEIANTPLFIWDPRSGVSGARRDGLVSTIDLGPTLLDLFGQTPTERMRGIPLTGAIARNEDVHDALLFGYFGREMNVTDGRYVYMRGGPHGQPVHEYTLMPWYMERRMPLELLRQATLNEGFSFTQGCPVLKLPRASEGMEGTMLFDLRSDPHQGHALDDPETERRMAALMRRLMIENEAPKEQLDRLSL